MTQLVDKKGKTNSLKRLGQNQRQECQPEGKVCNGLENHLRHPQGHYINRIDLITMK